MPIGAPSRKPRYNLRPPAQIRSASHKAFIRRQPCVCRGKPGMVCGGDVQCAHFRTANDGGMGLKPCDSFTFPACEAHHRHQHDIGEKAFAVRYGLNLRAICRAMALRSPDPQIRARAIG